MKANIPLRLSSAQRKAMDAEINRQILEHDTEFSMDNDATVLWTLHTCFGFGEKRLRRFWEACFQEHTRLRQRYEMSPDDDGWLYRRMLKDIGVDIEQWYKETEK